ncbi:MAG: hypothetical protein ACP5XB_04995 [Isosphaeraceae bacterium]
MSDGPLKLETSEHARFQYMTLGVEDRRDIDVWFDQLRNWRNDPLIRSKSKHLKTGDETYTIQAGSDLVLAFKITDDAVTILAIFRKEALRPFEAMAERAGT